MLLFLTTNMAAVTSLANQQLVHGVRLGLIWRRVGGYTGGVRVEFQFNIFDDF